MCSVNIGVIDIGSNSVRMAWVAEKVEKDILPQERLAYSRLAEGATQTGTLSEVAVARTIDAIQSLLDQAHEYEVQIQRISATSALREAKNVDVVKKKMEKLLSYPITILSSEEEARYSYDGATFGLPQSDKMVAVLDVGGGSSELCWGIGKDKAASVPVGAVRLKEFGEKMGNLSHLLAPLIQNIPKQPLLLVGVGGTVTTMAAVFEKMLIYHAQTIHQRMYGIGDIIQFNEKLKKMPMEQRLDLEGMTAARADILPYGMEIVIHVMQALQSQTLTVSTTDLLLGQLLEITKS